MYLFPKQELPEGYDPTGRPWYQGVLNNKGKASWSDVYIDATSGESVLTVSKYIENNGETIGVLALR